MVFQERGLFGGFHAFGHNAHFQSMSHGDQGAHHAAVGIGLSTEHRKAAVQLEAVYRQFAQVRQSWVAHAEVVNRNADAELAQLVEQVGGPAAIRERPRFL